MIYILLFLFILAVILIIFLYNIWKDEPDFKIVDNFIKSEDQIIQSMKESFIDNNNFKKWLKNIKIVQEDFVKIKNEISKKIIWMDEFVNSIMISLLIWWHLLVEWVPWLAKTKTIEIISSILDMKFVRAQFTPDMLPSDIVWVEIYNIKNQEFEVKKWMIFTNIFLADEINRTTPKVQSALLEAMQEKKISIWWEDFILPEPFCVLATQNPLEQEWTYPLPEAQLDRFLFKILVDYPNLEEEKKILNVMENDKNIKIDKIIDLNKFMELQKQVSNVKISDNIKDYISRLVNISRKKDDRLLYWASPRASINLLFSSKALAFLQWRDYVVFEDIQNLALSTMRHRIILSYDSKVDWFSEDDFLLEILPKINLS